MGCSHSARDPSQIKRGRDKMAAQIQRYKKFNYAETDQNQNSIPMHRTVGPAIPSYDFQSKYRQNSNLQEQKAEENQRK